MEKVIIYSSDNIERAQESSHEEQGKKTSYGGRKTNYV